MIPESRLTAIESLTHAMGMSVDEQRELVAGYREAQQLRAWAGRLAASEPHSDESAWREGWAMAYSGVLNLYGDDGELHDASAAPVIDWRRDSATTIRAKIMERGMRQLERMHGEPIEREARR